jgi:hypothetical protein
MTAQAPQISRSAAGAAMTGDAATMRHERRKSEIRGAVLLYVVTSRTSSCFHPFETGSNSEGGY